MLDLRPSLKTTKLAAFAAIYLVWGSTYLAIALLAETLPAFSMVGLRFFVAGLALYLWARAGGAARPEPRHWRSGAVSGGLLLFVGTGGVVWSIGFLDSGLVALLVGTMPLWMALLMWLWPGGRRPSAAELAALAVGFCGAAVLAAPSAGGTVHLGATLVALVACAGWAVGSLYSRGAELPASPAVTTGIQMLTGGGLLLAGGVAAGEWRGFEPQAVSATSLVAFAYLVVFGSLGAFTAYSWLIRNTDPTLVATHAYVNPVVAVFLGWWLAGESVGPRTLLATALIVGSVVLVTASSARRRKLEARAPEPERLSLPRGVATAPRRLEKCA